MGLQRKGNRMKPKHTVLYCKQQFQLEFRSWTYRTHPVALRIPYRAYGDTAAGLPQAEFAETVDGSPIGVDIIEGCSHTRQAHQSAIWIWRTHSVSSGEQLNPDPNIGGVVAVTCALSGPTKLSAVSQQSVYHRLCIYLVRAYQFFRWKLARLSFRLQLLGRLPLASQATPVALPIPTMIIKLRILVLALRRRPAPLPRLPPERL
jgi:hypothetical protein